MVRLEHGAGKAWRGDAAKIAAIVGRQQIVDVERPERFNRSLLWQPEAAASP
jgi:hypothetical protein